MAEQTETREGLREMLSPAQASDRLEEAVQERPMAKHLLDLKIVAKAVLIAAVLTLIAVLLAGAVLAAFVLVISFFASWFILAKRSHERRRPTKRIERDGDGDGETDSAEDDDGDRRED
jgi:Flp pilus assembly protein TadB